MKKIERSNLENHLILRRISATKIINKQNRNEKKVFALAFFMEMFRKNF